MKAYSFPRGGISLEDDTAPSGDACSVAFLPALSLIHLDRPGGALAPLVEVGDTVREGMLVGRRRHGGEAGAHATVPGRVVEHAAWVDGEGRRREGLLIRMEGSFGRLGSAGQPVYGAPTAAAPASGAGFIGFRELAGILDECGIVEMEGSGAPLTALLGGFAAAKGRKTVVARCVIDDPWLAADRVLCAERGGAVVEGAFLLAAACAAGRVVFAVSRAERKLGEAMLAGASGYALPASLVLTGSRYPQRNGREMELVLREYGRKEKVEPGTTFLIGPATLAAVHDAVRYRRPILERYVAVGGSAVKKPGVMRVRIGKRVGDLLRECGGPSGSPFRVISGSPFFGETVRYLDEPVTATSYAVVAMLETAEGKMPERDCISCGECRRVCPVGLDPEEMYKTATAGRHAAGTKAAGVSAEGGNLTYITPTGGKSGCHGCGCCEVVCPSRIRLPAVISDVAVAAAGAAAREAAGV